MGVKRALCIRVMYSSLAWGPKAQLWLPGTQSLSLICSLVMFNSPQQKNQNLSVVEVLILSNLSTSLLTKGTSQFLCWQESYRESTLIQQTFSKHLLWASLVAQWLRIHLTMQGTQVRSLVREDPTCCRETKPVQHNY